MPKPPLNNQSIQNYLQQIQENPELKAQTISQCRSDFKTFLANTFELTNCQQDAINNKLPAGYVQEMGGVIAVALENDYSLIITYPEDNGGNNLLGLDTEFYSKAGWSEQSGSYVEQGVTVSYSKD